MEALTTPDARFEGLPDYPFAPHHVTVDDGEGGQLRVHYVDEGPADAQPVLLMHGEPTWSYLYRHMIAPLAAAGHRVIAPDLVGFGRSDKPTRMEDYSYARQVDWMRKALLTKLDLRDITLFAQDWGGLIGLRLLAAEPERFARVCIANTGLPIGRGKIPEAFLAWQKFSREADEFPIGKIIAGGCVGTLPEAVIAAYDAPFPDDSYTAGPRIFPSLVPTNTEDPASADNLAAWEVLSKFERPFLLAFSDSDPITKGGEKPFLQRVPGTQGQPHVTIEGGGHFLQEDCAPQLVRLLEDFIAAD